MDMVTVTKRIQQQPLHNTRPPRPIPDRLRITLEVTNNMPNNNNKPKIFLYPENVEHYQDPIRGATTHINTIVLHKETCQEVTRQLILLRLVKDIKDRQQVPIIQHWEENVPLTIWPTSTTSTMANVVQCLAGKDKPHPK